MRFTFPRQTKEPWLCIADFFRPVDSGSADYAGFQVVTMGPGVSEETARLFADDRVPELPLPPRPRRRDGRGAGRVLAPPHPRGVGFADEDGPTLTGLFRQQYRGGRYSWGYPACPDLEDNAKVVELLGADRIGVEVSEGFQLHPEQTTDRHHLPPPPGQVLRGLIDRRDHRVAAPSPGRSSSAVRRG